MSISPNNCSALKLSVTLRLLIAVALAVITACIAASTASATFNLRYVALGDSYTAGPAIPNQIATDVPPGCAQSDQNYPHLIAALLRLADFADVSCSGARTVDMTQPQVTQVGTNPPQFDALTPRTRLVTVGIGGNDIGFSMILGACLTPAPVGQPCQDRFVQNGVDTLQQRIDATAPKIAAVLQGINTRSPHAKVLLVGYVDILPLSGPGCFPQVPLAPADVPYLNGVEVSLNRMLARTARANDAEYVDSYRATIGHDACQTPDVRWVEPLSPVNPAAPFHPNADGHKAMFKATLFTLLFDT